MVKLVTKVVTKTCRLSQKLARSCPLLTKNWKLSTNLSKQTNVKFNNCPTRWDLFSLLYFCRQLYMFRLLTPIIRSSYNYNYSFWYWLTAMSKIRCLQKCNKLNKSHLVGKLLNSIHDARTHVYKKNQCQFSRMYDRWEPICSMRTDERADIHEAANSRFSQLLCERT